MNITRRSAIKKVGTIIGSAALLGVSDSAAKASGSADKESGKQIFNIKDYGAKGDGKRNDAKAINKAIAAAAEAGGGEVFFPAGRYLSGSVHLQSNITLHLGQGAVLEATEDPHAYDPAEPFSGKQYQDYGHSHWHNSFIWGENLHHVNIEGPGTIYGKGLLRYHSKKASEKGLGNKSIALKECRNVHLKDFTIKHGGWFGILATGVDNFTMDNLLIDTNRDGIDIDCCRNVSITNCSVNSPHDDAICPKSSYALGKARATQDVTIMNCHVSGFKEGTLLDGTYQPFKAEENDNPTGRIKFGTESNGGFKNITISNCTFDYCRGIALETVDGGLLEDVSISNITMRNVGNAPIFMRLGSRMRGPEGTSPGELRRINISDIVIHHANKKTGILLSGIPEHTINDIKISNIYIQYEGGGTRKAASLQPPENAGKYPEPSMFGQTPAYGFYMRYVKGIEVTNAKLTYEAPEGRSAFALDHVTEADFRFIKARHEKDTPTFSLHKVQDFRLFESGLLPNSKLHSVDQKEI